MTRQISFSNTKLDKTMEPEQFDRVVEAILAGRYSWACVLILRFAGYNPLHYIPYRTYNRLLKENCQVGSSSRQTTHRIKADEQKSEATCAETSTQHCSSKLRDLSYLEVMDKQKTQVEGGKLDEWLDTIKFDLAECARQDFSVLSW
ncbi:MAG: HetP family heterocyst commitment protein [Chroococcidiopsidaceae cyanobacterium CP_BM_RX_35]|nr:HetP family heterocyst commitment protein [Chroococcidiopsidaceae cyanobacterium CP_BM_RX_35]